MKSLFASLSIVVVLCGSALSQTLKWTAEVTTDPDFADAVFYSDGTGGGVVRGTAGNTAVYYWFNNKGVLKGSATTILANDQGTPLMVSPTRFYALVRNAPFSTYILRRYTGKKGGGLDTNSTSMTSIKAANLLAGTQEKANDKLGFALAYVSSGTLYVERYSH